MEERQKSSEKKMGGVRERWERHEKVYRQVLISLLTPF